MMFKSMVLRAQRVGNHVGLAQRQEVPAGRGGKRRRESGTDLGKKCLFDRQMEETRCIRFCKRA
jgi:hypothetical protein